VKLLQSVEEFKKILNNKIMPFVAQIKKEFETKGIAALALQLPFNEQEFIQANSSFIIAQVGVPELVVQLADEETSQKCVPGAPHILFQ